MGGKKRGVFSRIFPPFPCQVVRQLPRVHWHGQTYFPHTSRSKRFDSFGEVFRDFFWGCSLKSMRGRGSIKGDVLCCFFPHFSQFTGSFGLEMLCFLSIMVGKSHFYGRCLKHCGW